MNSFSHHKRAVLPDEVAEKLKVSIWAIAILASISLPVGWFALRARSSAATLKSRTAFEPEAPRVAGASTAGEFSPTSTARLEAEVIVVSTDGFQPATITRPKGPFVLMIRNHTGLSQIDVRLDPHGGGNRVLEAPFAREEPRWHWMFDLPPGSYDVTEAGHSDWVCHITINP